MNQYLMAVKHYFSGEETFEVEAENKAEAVEVGTKLVNNDPYYTVGGNFDRKSVRVVKKLRPKSKAE